MVRRSLITRPTNVGKKDATNDVLNNNNNTLLVSYNIKIYYYFSVSIYVFYPKSLKTGKYEHYPSIQFYTLPINEYTRIVNNV